MADHDPARATNGGVRQLGLTVYGCDRDEADLFHVLAPPVGIVPTTTADAISVAGIRRPMRGGRCASVGHRSEVSRRELVALKDVGVEHLSTRSIGLDHIDLEAADDLGITVENVVYAPDGVADFTLMLILMAIRHATEFVSSPARSDVRPGGVRGRDLCDMTVGVVGVGRIGRAVIRRLQGFGCRVLACSNAPAAPAGAELVSLADLLHSSDVVTLHVPLTAGTHHLIGRPQIQSMRPGAFLVNTGRGGLVDTDALIGALESGRLGGTALDVLEGEDGLFHPDAVTEPADHPFLARLHQLPNALVTPHTAYRTARMLRETVESTLTQCLTFERNRPDEEAQSRDLVRGLLGGARRLGEVGDGDRGQHRHRAV